ncbi:MAG: hypothetical protein ACXW08_11540 [Solirubrobacteraceae bacterium]
MYISSRTIALGLATATLALSPAVAVAEHGADDGPAHNIGDDKGGLRDDKGGRDDSGGERDDKRNEKRVAGSCTGRSSSKLKAKPDDGRLETEFEVDQNRNGVHWKVRIRRNGKLVVKTRATTRAPSGSFSVERRIADPAGSDRITARAVSPSGEVCRASVTI